MAFFDCNFEEDKKACSHMCMNLLSLSQADQMMFAMHFVKGMHPELFQESVSICVDLVSASAGFHQD